MLCSHQTLYWSIKFEVITTDEFSQSLVLDLTIHASIIDTPFDLIMGRPTIKENGLAKRFFLYISLRRRKCKGNELPTFFKEGKEPQEEMLSTVQDWLEKIFVLAAQCESIYYIQ